jgi:1,2-dihydroxy-3-keto-5-methylthiopentene dioxygenase
MARAWFFEESKESKNEPHYPEPFEGVSEEYLKKLGILCFKGDPVNYETDEAFKTITKERGYNYHDFISVSKEGLPNYEEKMNVFYDEHLHDFEEIRFFLEGSAYFDIKDEITQKWIRIEGSVGDMLVLPAGIFHRFTLTTSGSARLMRLFQSEPVWQGFSRKLSGTDNRESHVKYVQTLRDSGVLA